jgi:hypothetical protein
VSVLLLVFIYSLFYVDLDKWLYLLLPFSDEENPERFAAVAIATDTPAIDEPPSQEVDLVVKSRKAPRAPFKKVVATHGSKRVKKSIDVGASLEAHRSTSSSDDVCVDTGIFAFVSCVIFILTYFFWIELDE